MPALDPPEWVHSDRMSTLLHHDESTSSVVGRVGAAHLEQLKAQSPTVAGWPGTVTWSTTRPLLVVAAPSSPAGPATVAPGQPVAVACLVAADVVVHRRRHRASASTLDQPMKSATMANTSPMPEHHSAQLACR